MKPMAMLVGLWLVAAVVRADVIDPNQEACNGRSAGDSCGDGARCVQSTCGRIDYSGGQGPRSTSVACLICRGDARASALSDNAPARREVHTTAAVGVAVLATGVLFAFLWHRRSNGSRARS